MSNKIQLTLVLCLILIIGILLGIKLQKELILKRVSAKRSLKIETVLSFIESRYIDSIDRQDLSKRIFSDSLRKFDTNTNYSPSKQLQKINEQVDIKPYSNK